MRDPHCTTDCSPSGQVLARGSPVAWKREGGKGINDPEAIPFFWQADFTYSLLRSSSRSKAFAAESASCMAQEQTAMI